MPGVRQRTNPLVRNIFPLLVIFLAAIFSAVLEKTPVISGLHLLAVMGGVALIAIAVSGRFRTVAKHPIGRTLLLFTVWMLVCIPFSVWKGGSVNMLINVWYKSLLVFFLVAGAVSAVDQERTIFKTIGYSVGLLAIITLILQGQDKMGRLGLIGTRYENSNDLGWTLILGLSFLSYFVTSKVWREKLIATVLALPILLAVVKTGSRATMLGMAVLLFFYYLQASKKIKIILAVSVPFVAVVLLAATPKEMLSRYFTFFSVNANATKVEISAMESTEQRWQLLKDSITLTLTHPIFGVGPDMFQVAQADLALARGDTRGAWRVTHNTYTQVSSEMGIPGLAIYLAFLYQCFAPLNGIIRTRAVTKEWQELNRLAKSLRVTFAIMVTVAMFGSFAYDANIPILAGLSCALALIAQRQRALSRASAQPIPQSIAVTEPDLAPAYMRS